MPVLRFSALGDSDQICLSLFHPGLAQFRQRFALHGLLDVENNAFLMVEIFALERENFSAYFLRTVVPGKLCACLGECLYTPLQVTLGNE